MWIIELVILFTLGLLIVSMVMEKYPSRQKLNYVNSFDFWGAKINFRVVGKGKPIILLHGSMVYDPWSGFEEILAKKFKVNWIDLPGFGGSETVRGEVHNTDLFAKCLGEFIRINKLGNAPIISLSLGTIVAAKVVASGLSQGKQIMVGAPGKLFGLTSRLACWVPILIRRMVANTNWGKKTLLIPMLRGNTGDKKGDDSKLLRNLMVTDPKSLADINYQKEIEVDMQKALAKIKSKRITFIYGELDNQKGTISTINKYRIIKDAGHSPFGSHGNEVMKIVEEVLT